MQARQTNDGAFATPTRGKQRNNKRPGRWLPIAAGAAVAAIAVGVGVTLLNAKSSDASAEIITVTYMTPVPDVAVNSAASTTTNDGQISITFVNTPGAVAEAANTANTANTAASTGNDADQITITFVNTPAPTTDPSAAAVAQVNVAPTDVPPTAIPTAVPTEVPTEVPTAVPTEIPTEVPTAVPTAIPTEVPTLVPTASPTAVPTLVPTAVPPTAVPTKVPTRAPTLVPTVKPSALPAETAEPEVMANEPAVKVIAGKPAAGQIVPTRAPEKQPTPAPLSINSKVAEAEGMLEQKAATTTDVSCPKPVGQVFTETMRSKITAAPITVNVYVPPCYNPRDYTYPTLYLIHGTAFEQGGWIYDGVPRVADIQMSIGALPPFIIVMPGADMRAGQASVYSWSNSGPKSYEGFVVNELIPYIDGKYSTWASREGRAIGGISRGGYWSIQIGFANPDKFSSVGGHSPSVGQMLVGMPAGFSMLDTAKSIDALHTLRIWLDAGNADWARFDAKKLADDLDNEKIDYSIDIGEGSHEDSYWTSRVPDYLAFYATGWPREARTRQAMGMSR